MDMFINRTRRLIVAVCTWTSSCFRFDFMVTLIRV